MNNIRTILFDLDGTLINTNSLIQASFQHTFKTFGYQLSEEETKKFNGPPLMDTFRSVDPEQAEQMLKAYLTHNHANHDRYVTAFPGAVETVKVLKEQGFKLGIVTTKMRKGAEMGLALTGLAPLFETVITFDDVENPKPDPEPVLKAMQALNGEARSTLMVGDNYHDIVAGQRAGMQTAGVDWSQHGRDFLLQYEPTYMLESMGDLLELTGVAPIDA